MTNEELAFQPVHIHVQYQDRHYRVEVSPDQLLQRYATCSDMLFSIFYKALSALHSDLTAKSRDDAVLRAALHELSAQHPELSPAIFSLIYEQEK